MISFDVYVWKKNLWKKTETLLMGKGIEFCSWMLTSDVCFVHLQL